MDCHDATAAIAIVDAVLRLSAFGCFAGHGWIAFRKLEFGGWSKFMGAAGFREAEAHVIMPLIGLMDLTLALVTVLRPMELITCWMVVWGLSTALMRPISAGWNRTLNPLSDNAVWGFIERASNWGVPFALLALQKTQGYSPVKIIQGGYGDKLSGLDATLNLTDNDLFGMCKIMGFMFVVLWGVVLLLRMRGPRASSKTKTN